MDTNFSSNTRTNPSINPPKDTPLKSSTKPSKNINDLNSSPRSKVDPKYQSIRPSTQRKEDQLPSSASSSIHLKNQ